MPRHKLRLQTVSSETVVHCMPRLQKELYIVDCPHWHLEFDQHFDYFQALIYGSGRAVFAWSALAWSSRLSSTTADITTGVCFTSGSLNSFFLPPNIRKFSEICWIRSSNTKSLIRNGSNKGAFDFEMFYSIYDSIFSSETLRNWLARIRLTAPPCGTHRACQDGPVEGLEGSNVQFFPRFLIKLSCWLSFLRRGWKTLEGHGDSTKHRGSWFFFP